MGLYIEELTDRLLSHWVRWGIAPNADSFQSFMCNHPLPISASPVPLFLTHKPQYNSHIASSCNLCPLFFLFSKKRRSCPKKAARWARWTKIKGQKINHSLNKTLSDLSFNLLLISFHCGLYQQVLSCCKTCQWGYFASFSASLKS